MNDEKREKHRLYMQRYMASNPEQQERARARARAYYEAHATEIAARRKTPAFRASARTKSKAWRDANPQVSYRKGLRLRGITEDEFEQILRSRGGGCYFCGKTEEDSRGDIRRLALDHDHNTGALRGILCFACNISLGYAERGRISRLLSDMPKLNAYLGTKMTVTIKARNERATQIADGWLGGEDVNDIAATHAVTRSRVYQILAETILIEVF